MVEILYENKELLVCIKPAGTLSEKSDSPNSLPSLIEKEYLEKNTPISLFAVHRLDKEVSGVMVYAKSAGSAKELSAQIADRKFHKEYLAIVEGVPEKKQDILKDLLFKDSKRNKSYVVKRERKGVKEASLEYKTLATKDETSLLQIFLHTGRTHQIRVQFASRGHSIIGDKKYGSQISLSAITLCSHKIAFSEPITKKVIEFTYIPKDLNIWNNYHDILENLHDLTK